MTDLTEKYEQLWRQASDNNFFGWDPFDGLESRIFRVTPLRYFRSTRLLWQQAVKRSPVNLRRLLIVPKSVNSKGLALFLLAATARHRAEPTLTHHVEMETLVPILLGKEVRNSSANTLAFGYNFDWQSRAFFAPKGLPTIVPTAFAARAIYEYWRQKGGWVFERALIDIGHFISKDLNRSIDTADEICFSYTPLDHTKIYNASLLAAEALAYGSEVSSEYGFRELSQKAVRFVLNGQREDGSWLYGPGEIHGWVDNFHTAFVLDSLRRISELMPWINSEVEPAIDRGFEYWVSNFFLDDGTPKYFDQQTYPIDIHSAAAAIVTLAGFAGRDIRALPLARKVADLMVANLIGPDGSTYYQKRRLFTVKTPFVRWGQAWTAYALASLIEAEIAK
ncbi:MAG: hypothetical protein ABL984_06465 [Pyrinomonadaceae bacterium]